MLSLEIALTIVAHGRCNRCTASRPDVSDMRITNVQSRHDREADRDGGMYACSFFLRGIVGRFSFYGIGFGTIIDLTFLICDC